MGGQKKCLGAQINFTFIVGREAKKKGLNQDLLSGHKSRLGGGHVHCLTGPAESNGADLASCPQI